MPRATLCLGCGATVSLTEIRKGRCPACRRRQNAQDFYQSPQWRRLARRAKRLHGACAICGSTSRLTAHHAHARRKGGPDTEENIVLLCGADAVGMPWDSCHSQYEADKRTGKNTELRRLVDAL